MSDVLNLRDFIKELRASYTDKERNCLTRCGLFIASQLFIEIVEYVKKLYDKCPPVIHKSLIIENIILTEKGKNGEFIRLNDIGFAIYNRHDYIQHINFIAPEVIKFRKYTKESDIYALGEISYELFNIDFDGLPYKGIDRVKYEHLVDSIIELKSYCASKRLTCSQLLESKDLWSLLYAEVCNDTAIKSIVSCNYAMITNEDKFVHWFVQSKAFQSQISRSRFSGVIDGKSLVYETPKHITEPQPSTSKSMNEQTANTKQSKK